MSKPVSWSMPADKVCMKIFRKDEQICDLKYGMFAKKWIVQSVIVGKSITFTVHIHYGSIFYFLISARHKIVFSELIFLQAL